MKMKSWILISLFLFIATFAHAQHNFIKFDHFTVDEGLSNANVLSVAQDQQGFLWLGTEDGLCRYDGFETVIYKHTINDSTSISSNYVTAIVVDKQNNLWVGTRLGLNLYARDTNSFRRFSHYEFGKYHMSGSYINTLYIDSRNNLWIGFSEGLCLKKNGSDRIVMFDPDPENEKAISGSNFMAITEDANGDVWVGSLDGDLCRYNYSTSEFQRFKASPTSGGLQTTAIRGLLPGKKNWLWIATSNYGLCKFNTDTQQTLTFNTNNSRILSNEIFTLGYGADSALWVGTNNGVSILGTDRFQFSNHDAVSNDNFSLVGNSITSFFLDKQNTMWISSRNGGVDFFNPIKYKFRHYSTNALNKNSLSHNIITAITEDDKKRIWVATDGGGVNLYNPKNESFVRYNKSPQVKLTSNKVLAIAADKNELWMGTWAAGLMRWNPDKNTYRYYKNIPGDTTSLRSDYIFYLFIDSDNDLWVANWNGGFHRYRRETDDFERFPKDSHNFEQLQKGAVRSISEDKQGNIWIAAEGYGANRYNKRTGELKRFGVDNGVTNNVISTIFCDSKGRIWLGSDGGGINYYDPKQDKFTTIPVDGEFPSNVINCLNEDEEGFLWASSNNGLFRIEVVSEQNTPVLLKFRTYTESDGLQGRQFNKWATYKSSQGELYFGGVNGLNIFTAKSIKDNLTPPGVMITGFKLSNKPVKIGAENSPLEKSIMETNELELTHEQSVMSFQYTAINYINSEKNRFAYQMVGFDKEWNYVGSKREVTYTNLDPGDYVFRVKAANNDGIWNEKGASLKVRILPPWWETLWFRILAVVFILGSVSGGFILRIRMMKRQKEQLEKTVAERTAELREVNVYLSEKQEEILQQNEEILSINEELETRNTDLIKAKNEIEKSYKNSEAISEFGQKITSNLDFDTISSITYGYLKGFMDMDAMGIGFCNFTNDTIDFPYFIDNDKQLPLFSNKLEQNDSLSAYCVRTRNDVIIQEADIELSRYLPNGFNYQTGKLPQTLVYLLLKNEKGIFGVFTVQSYQAHQISGIKLTSLKTFASYLSIALDNSNAYRQINQQNEHINNSINYAKTIQSAILPRLSDLSPMLDCGMMYKPKDVVSGDFFWWTNVEINGLDAKLVAVADCTGHGVPGAFMSMIGSRLLSEISMEMNITDPKQVLENLDWHVKKALRQEETQNNDGMELGLCLFMPDTAGKTKLVYSGAKGYAYCLKHSRGQLERLAATRRSIGGGRKRRKNLAFENIEMLLEKGDVLYLFSDGIIHQPSQERKSFGSQQLEALLLSNWQKGIAEQCKLVEEAVNNHKGKQEQRDDMTFMAIRLA